MTVDEAMKKGESVISLPKWAWAAITSLLGVLLTGGMMWATKMSDGMNDLRTKMVDRKEVEQLLETSGPYMRDKANIEARIMSAEKMLDRHDADSRRVGEILSRVEAKLDLVLPKKNQ